MICNNCLKSLSDVAGICPYCGTAVNVSAAFASRPLDPDAAQKTPIDRIGRSIYNRAALPQDERLRKIISDFEIKSNVVFVKPQALRVYNGPNTHYTKRMYNDGKVSPAYIILNIALTLLLPPVGFIRSIYLIVKKDGPGKKLGLAMLILSILLICACVWVIITMNLLPINLFI